ncbi:hypothetical protein [Borborobacter arsenicus]|uniref:hypothetical protein n=1 Tax=Borborobacter arsenicus TaxID=1851146 RepID=UPI001FDFB8C9|nr:hypothetical protein [Pseudaminobacter arsenicus]
MPTALGLLKDGSAKDVEKAEPFVTGDDQANYFVSILKSTPYLAVLAVPKCWARP